MVKILQTGILPQNIFRLIYQHYDPDLRYYGISAPLLDIDALSNRFTFATGRELRFIHTPYTHSTGSFMTYDSKTETLLSSDLFGSKV